MNVETVLWGKDTAMFSNNQAAGLPAYERLRRDLLIKIESGELTERIPSERDLAKQYGISHMTARRAVCELVDKGVLIRGKGRRGTYVADKRLRSMKGAIGVLSPLAEREQHFDPYGASLLAAIQEMLCEHGLRLHLAPQIDAFFETSNSETGESLCNALASVDGILKLPCKPDKRFKEIVKIVPSIALSTWAPGLPRVGADDVAGARRAVEYLTGKGHERIAHLSHRPRSLMARDRCRGYEQAMDGLGLEQHAIVLKCNGGRKAVEGAFRRFMDLNPRPTAIFCSTDESAAIFMGLLQSAGVGIPDKVSIMGFGDLEIARYLHPALTTMQAPCRCMAFCAVERLLNWIKTGEPPEESALLLSVEIAERDSVKNI